MLSATVALAAVVSILGHVAPVSLFTAPAAASSSTRDMATATAAAPAASAARVTRYFGKGAFEGIRRAVAETRAQGANWWARVDPGGGAVGSGEAPLSAPLYVVKRGGLEERHWMTEDTGYPTDLSARRRLGQNARPMSGQPHSGLQWIDHSDLCDLARPEMGCAPEPAATEKAAGADAAKGGAGGAKGEPDADAAAAEGATSGNCQGDARAEGTRRSEARRRRRRHQRGQGEGRRQEEGGQGCRPRQGAREDRSSPSA